VTPRGRETDTPLRIALIGTGKMGIALRERALARGLEIVAELDRSVMTGDPENVRRVLGSVDVALEFTDPASVLPNIETCLKASCPVVTGTTGWYDRLPDVTKSVAEADGTLLWAPNFSIGVALFTQLVRRAGELAAMVPDFDLALIETHHREKRDAPSGTAIRLRDAAEAAYGDEVPVTSVRTGFVPGTHEVTMDAHFERISLTHEARDRRVFADGAITAAIWLSGRKGMFTMDDVFTMENP